MITSTGLKDYTVVFDLDGTLVDTDKANSMAYQQAVYDETGLTLKTSNKRLTREYVQSYLKVNESIMQKIIKQKEEHFIDYLNCTIPLPSLYLLKNLQNTHNILLTLSRKQRANLVLDYYSASKYFRNKYYREDFYGKSKFDFLINELHNAPDTIILFENDKDMIKEAVLYGIPQINIYQS